MEKPVLINVQLTRIVPANQFATSLPKTSTLNNIRARARAVRPL